MHVLLRYRVLCFSILFFLCGMCFFPQYAQALGISPSMVVLDNIRNDVEITKKIYISRANPYAREEYKFEVTGDAAPYIIPPERVILPKNQQQVEVPIQIVPHGLPMGTYSAQIAIRPVASLSEGTSIQVLSAIAVNFSFTITEEVITNTHLKNVYVQVGDNPSEHVIHYSLVNEGNIPWDLQTIHVTLLKNDLDPNFKKQTIILNNLNVSVPPKSSIVQKQTFYDELDPGNYTVQVELLGTQNVEDLRESALLSVSLSDLSRFHRMRYNIVHLAPWQMLLSIAVIVIFLVSGFFLIKFLFRTK